MIFGIIDSFKYHNTFKQKLDKRGSNQISGLLI